jgi:hypothetical protein
MLRPPTIPMLELRYNPELAMAIWHESTPAARGMNVTPSAMPFPNPLGTM